MSFEVYAFGQVLIRTFCTLFAFTVLVGCVAFLRVICRPVFRRRGK